MDQLSFENLLDRFTAINSKSVARDKRRRVERMIVNSPTITHLVLFENRLLDASSVGSNGVLAVGPGFTLETPEQAQGRHLNDLPSQRMYAVAYCEVDRSQFVSPKVQVKISGTAAGFLRWDDPGFQSEEGLGPDLDQEYTQAVRHAKRTRRGKGWTYQIEVDRRIAVVIARSLADFAIALANEQGANWSHDTRALIRAGERVAAALQEATSEEIQ